MRKILPFLLLLAMLPAMAAKVKVTVRAYTGHGRTATGATPHRGTCAGPRKWLGRYIHVPGMGWYKVTDVCRSGIDLWMPTRKKCLSWGRRTLTVRVERHRR